MQHLTIGRAAAVAGVSVETIRFYERRGLIEQPPKGGGFRVYPAELVARIRFIRQAQQIGFSLREVQELLALRATSGADCADVRRQAAQKIEEVDRKIADLRRVRTALEAVISSCPGRGRLKDCTIMTALEDAAQ
ncbi:MAG: MerR family DNA-binding protein [Methylobacterium sp.]|uniref:MerR family transcriptional regulator n=1 Tax=Methylobacterium sp. TaxID=409 RepID=UPI00258E8BB1|nr:MerR family DNA-binding protein [Methylobacterium sp.]MBY0298729.1 MerR family DNA-binding protein [Methylobacterium sp.]